MVSIVTNYVGEMVYEGEAGSQWIGEINHHIIEFRAGSVKFNKTKCSEIAKSQFYYENNPIHCYIILYSKLCNTIDHYSER